MEKKKPKFPGRESQGVTVPRLAAPRKYKADAIRAERAAKRRKAAEDLK
jgi:hypothetical protein